MIKFLWVVVAITAFAGLAAIIIGAKVSALSFGLILLAYSSLVVTHIKTLEQVEKLRRG